MNSASMKPQVSSRRRQIDVHVPHLFGIFADGAVRREPAHARRVEDRGPPPARLAVERVDRPLRRPVGVEIGRHHEMIVVEQCLDDGAEPVRIVGRERAAPDAGNGLRQARRLAGRLAALEAGLPPLLDLVRGQAEDEDVVGADAVADLDVGAVERADRQRAVQRELHVAGAGGLHAGGRNLLRQIGRRNDVLGEADIVVRQEHDLQPAADLRDRR